MISSGVVFDLEKEAVKFMYRENGFDGEEWKMVGVYILIKDQTKAIY